MEGALYMRKSMIVPVLLLSLLLTACGGEEAGSGRNLFWDELGVAETEIVLTVDGREIPAWRYCWWLAAGCEAMESACSDTGMAVDWDAPLEEGTLADYVEQQALTDTVLYATVENWAQRWNVALTVEPAGEGVSPGILLVLEDWQRQELDAVGLLYGELCALAEQEDSPLVSAEELAAFGQREGYITVDQIVFSAGEDREAARQQAEEAFARLNNAGNKAAVFEALSVGDGSGSPQTLRVGDGTLDPVLESAAAALEPEQHSGILETETGFFILRRLPADRTALASRWLEDALVRAAEAAEVERAQGFQKLTADALMKAVAEQREE